MTVLVSPVVVVFMEALEVAGVLMIPIAPVIAAAHPDGPDDMYRYC